MSKTLTATTGITAAPILTTPTTESTMGSVTEPDTQQETAISTIKFENKVYIAFSKWDVKKIVELCRGYGDVYWSRLVYDKDGKETNRTYLILPDETYNGLVDDGYGEERKRPGANNRGAGFRIAPYVLREGQAHTDAPTLFVPAPKEHRKSAMAAENIVNAKLTILADCGIIPEKSWVAEAPTFSRESGDIKSGVFISFNETVERGRIAMTRILINDSYWPCLEDQETSSVFRCYWARDRTENKDRPAQKSRATQPETSAPRKDESKLSVVDREKLQEERRLARLTKLLEKAVPSETTVVVKGNKVPVTQPSVKK